MTYGTSTNLEYPIIRTSAALLHVFFPTPYASPHKDLGEFFV
jgi:hypothetical protein